MNELQPTKKGVKLAILFAAILVGVLFLFLGIKMFNILFTIIGAILGLGGILAICSKRIISGILLAGIGGVIIASAWIESWTNVAYIVFGVMMVISGVFSFFASVMREDARSCVSSVISAVLGGFLIGFRKGADWMIYVIGALFILLGVVGVILVLIPSKKGVKTVDVKEVK